MHRPRGDFWRRKPSIDDRPRPWDRSAVPSCRNLPDDSPDRCPDARRMPSIPCSRTDMRNTRVTDCCLASCCTWPWHWYWRETTRFGYPRWGSSCPSNRSDNSPRWLASRGDRYSRDEYFLKDTFVVHDINRWRGSIFTKISIWTLINQFLEILR